VSLTVESYPEEYARPPVYGRPPGASMVKLVERVTVEGKTQTEAMTPVPGSTTNG
jgi:hypothetical protein